MDIELHEGPEDFRERVGPFLRARESLHTLHLGILNRMTGADAPPPEAPALFLSVQSGDDVTGFAMRTPPHKLLLSDLPPAVAAELAPVIYGDDPGVPAVLAERDTAAAFAEAWSTRSGLPWTWGMAQALHELTELRAPDPVEGWARVAGPEDSATVVLWTRAFEREAMANVATPDTALQRKIREGQVVLWMRGDEPVSMAGCAARTRRCGRVGPVYTPPTWRGRGFGTAATAAMTLRLLDGGATSTVLYTDLANSTSNKIYHALGYRVIQTLADVHLSHVPGGPST